MLSRSSSHTTATEPLRFMATAGGSWSPVATLFAVVQVTASAVIAVGAAPRSGPAGTR
ncbi:hypothetical protein NKG94_20995 [Micromonospora sp. M12]